MTDLEKAVLEQALEALTIAMSEPTDLLHKYGRAADALRQALEQPAQQQEPVAYVDGDEAHRRILWEPSQAAFDLAVGTKLYTHPPVIDKSAAIRIATALGWEPKREWVGLTDEEVIQALNGISFNALTGFNIAEAIEAKLKEKNCG